MLFDAVRETPGLTFYGNVNAYMQLCREDFLGTNLYLKNNDLGNNAWQLFWNETKGDHYEVVLYSTGTADNREVDSQPGTGSVGSFGPLLRSEDVSGATAGFIEFEGLHSYYETATVTANITKDGRITDLKFNTPCILHFDKVSAARIIKVGVCEIGLLFQQTYKIDY